MNALNFNTCRLGRACWLPSVLVAVLALLATSQPGVAQQFTRRTQAVGLERVTGNRRKNSAGAGWEYVHVAIDDHSRVSFACIQPGETALSACSALVDTLRYFRTLGVAFTRVMTDNGSCYRSKRFAKLCRQLKMKHIRTRPYTPRTNGKAERFIQTALREWAYARAYDSSEQRGEYLPPAGCTDTIGIDHTPA